MQCLFMNNNVNYQKTLYKTLENIKNDGKKPKLLLHVCCGPCFSVPFDILKDFFDITIIYNNSNIYPEEEFYRRKNELKKYLHLIGRDEIEIVEVKYNPQEFLCYIKGHESDKEGHERCRLCFRYRLTYGYQYAQDHNFDYFGTVMSISRYKNAQDINAIGLDLEKEFPNVKWLCADFKKNNGYEKELVICRQFNLYFQEYCGCQFSYENFLKKHQ